MVVQYGMPILIGGALLVSASPVRRPVHDDGAPGEAAATEAEQVISDEVDRDHDVVSRLRATIVAMAGIAQRYPLLSVGTDLEPLPHQTRRPKPPPVSNAMQEALITLIRHGQQCGELRRDLPAELLPQAIVGTLRVVLRFARSLQTDPSLVGEQVADLLLDGFRDPGAPARSLESQKRRVGGAAAPRRTEALLSAQRAAAE